MVGVTDAVKIQSVDEHRDGLDVTADGVTTHPCPPRSRWRSSACPSFVCSILALRAPQGRFWPLLGPLQRSWPTICVQLRREIHRSRSISCPQSGSGSGSRLARPSDSCASRLFASWRSSWSMVPIRACTFHCGRTAEGRTAARLSAGRLLRPPQSDQRSRTTRADELL